MMTDNSRSAKVRIADLGSAIKLRSSHDTATFMIGTPGYIAPEVLISKSYSFGYDIWSIGALMHMLLSFRLPFYSKDSNELKRRLSLEELNLNANAYLCRISQPAKDLLSGMLMKNPRQRLNIDQVLIHPWFQ